jgi:hypothetical protein
VCSLWPTRSERDLARFQSRPLLGARVGLHHADPAPFLLSEKEVRQGRNDHSAIVGHPFASWLTGSHAERGTSLRGWGMSVLCPTGQTGLPSPSAMSYPSPNAEEDQRSTSFTLLDVAAATDRRIVSPVNASVDWQDGALCRKPLEYAGPGNLCGGVPRGPELRGRPLLAFRKILLSSERSESADSLALDASSRRRQELFRKTFEKRVSYSGKTRSSTESTLRLRSPMQSTRLKRKRLGSRSCRRTASGIWFGLARLMRNGSAIQKASRGCVLALRFPVLRKC